MKKDDLNLKDIRFEDIEKIINLIIEKNLAEFELEKEGLRIKIKKNIFPSVSIQTPNLNPSASPISYQEKIEHSVQKELTPSEDVYYIKSPIVGTFYRAPDPSSPPYVDEGDRVEKGQILCIVEAMKLMNEIESEVSGIIKSIFVENAQPVEYGQKLFEIKVLP
ncbi:MAG: acetyl-CoA carboxylase biotin carboxyl carrier protein [Acidobacteriota bacterium]